MKTLGAFVNLERKQKFIFFWNFLQFFFGLLRSLSKGNSSSVESLKHFVTKSIKFSLLPIYQTPHRHKMWRKIFLIPQHNPILWNFVKLTFTIHTQFSFCIIFRCSSTTRKSMQNLFNHRPESMFANWYTRWLNLNHSRSFLFRFYIN